MSYDCRFCLLTYLDPHTLRMHAHIQQNPTEDEYVSVVHAAEVNTWPAIPRIRAHCLVETTLERCVQRLRGRMTEESQAEQIAALEEQEQQMSQQRGPGLTKRDRTPSFYTSKSLVNLSGLSVADPAPIQQVWYHGNNNSREHLNAMHTQAQNQAQAQQSLGPPQVKPRSPRSSIGAASKYGLSRSVIRYP